MPTPGCTALFSLRCLTLVAGLATVALAPRAEAQIDTRNWFRLHFDVFGAARSVDVINDTTDDKIAMRTSGNFTGQYWRFEATNEVNYYRVSCRWQGVDKVLFAEPGQLARLVDRANDPRQLWKVSASPYAPGAFSISSRAFGGLQVLKAREVTPNRYRLEMVPDRPNPNRALRFISLGPIHPATVTQVGQGCTTPAGTLLLGPISDSAPWIGETIIGQMRGVPSDSNPYLAVGLLRASPIDLAPLGAPGCTWYVDGLTATALPLRLNISRWTLAIPNDETLIGAEIHVQGLALSGPQIRTSNAARLTLGAR